MKKLSILTAFVLLAVGFLWNQTEVSAQTEDKPADTSKFMKSSGVIKEIVTDKDLVTLTIETEEKEPKTSHIKINADTILMDSKSTNFLQKKAFKKGQHIDAYYDKNKPMIMIYPPQITPELVIVHDTQASNFVKVGLFNEEFLSYDKELKLNISKDTQFVNEKNETLDKEMATGKELVVFYQSSTKSIPAQTTPNKIVVLNSVQEDATNYEKYTGIIKDVVKKDRNVTLTVETEEKEPLTTIFTITDDTLLFNSGTTKSIKKDVFVKGQKIEAYYDKHKPRILIYPAQITPELVILHEKEFAFVKVSKFDEELVSLDRELKLDIEEKTTLVDEKGKAIKVSDLDGKELVVFYNFTKRGMEGVPDQTTPSKIVAIEYVSPEVKEIQKIIAEDHFMKNGVKMIPLRKVAEQLGFTVVSKPKLNAVFLTKGNDTFIFHRDNKTYSLNGMKQQFAEKTVLKNKKTYVSEEILNLLVQK